MPVLTVPETEPAELRARLPRRDPSREDQVRPRDWRILVPLAAVGHGWRVADPTSPQGETLVDVDPADPELTFRDDRIATVVQTLAGLLADDPYIQRAFQLLKLARTMKREYEPAQGRVIPLARAAGDQPVRFVVLPAGDAKMRHSARPFAYLEPVPSGYLRTETGGTSAILIYGPPRAPLEQMRRSLAHELAHYINHFIQDSGLPYSGRERRHSVYDIRTAAFAYVEGEPQAFLSFLQEGREPLIRKPRCRAAWVRRLLTPNQFLRSELACGRLLAALLNDRSIRNHYLRPSFYEVVAAAYPSLKGAYRLTREQVRAAVPPAENAYLKVQWVRLRHDPSDTLEFLRAYLTEFPSQRRLALKVIADVSSGLLITAEAPRRALAEACAWIRSPEKGLEVRAANRAWWRALVQRGTGLVGDTRTPLTLKTKRGELDLNRAEPEALARVLRIPATEALKLSRNRDALRPGEYLDLLDVMRPPPRAIRPNSCWDGILTRTWKKVCAASEAASHLSASPLRVAMTRMRRLKPQASGLGAPAMP